jgi:hypothetical protein
LDLPAVESELSEPTDEVPPALALLRAGSFCQQLPLNELEGHLKQLPARSHQGFENDFLKRGQRRVLGPGNFNRYREWWHVASPHSLSFEKRYVPIFISGRILELLSPRRRYPGPSELAEDGGAYAKLPVYRVNTLSIR